MAKLYIVQLHTRGWAVGVSFTEEERVLTSIYRLSREQKNKLHYLKVLFYRFLNKKSVFQLSNQYIVRERDLVEIEQCFRKIEKEFKILRREIFNELVNEWEKIKKELENYLSKRNINISIERLKPEEEKFLDLTYSIIPLDFQIARVFDLSEELKKKSEKIEEYKMLAERVKEEGIRRIKELKSKYDEKMKELDETIKNLKEALKKKSKEVYFLKLKVKEEVEDAKDIAEILGEETIEDLNEKLKTLQQFFVKK